ncbi:MAG: helix-turn-helix transcriptional regulator [Clostridiales bacterium]|nr:helix-turn-helix transcriptional regulator [Clostridiales bacterium]
MCDHPEGPLCRGDHVHGAEIAALAAEMPREEMLYDLAELYKVFGDSTRIRILYALFEAELCVCDIAALLGMTQSAISHQLRVLKQSKLVKYRREGKTIFYALADDHVRTIINMGMEHLCE